MHFKLFVILYVGLHLLHAVRNCCLSLLLNIGIAFKKVLERHFDGPGKVWNFLSVKVWEPCCQFYVSGICHMS